MANEFVHRVPPRRSVPGARFKAKLTLTSVVRPRQKPWLDVTELSLLPTKRGYSIAEDTTLGHTVLAAGTSEWRLNTLHAKGETMQDESAALGMPDAPAAGVTLDQPSRQEQAQSIIRYYSGWSIGAGIVPVPIVDMLLVSGVQIQMLRKLSELYEVNFSEHMARNLVAALLGGLVPQALSTSLVGPLIRTIPGIGMLLGMVTMPALSAAATYALGRVFTEHFESGGTLLTFDAAKMREFFRKEYAAARGSKPAAA
jgi:uncharacterized protein (DUF697 family)